MDKMSMANFIIFTTQRSGSTWLVDKLNSHTNIIAFETVFMRNAILGTKTRHGQKDLEKWKTYDRNNRGKIRPRSKRVFRYLDTIYYGDISRTNPSASCGFKFMYNDLPWFPEIIPYLLMKRLSIVHMYRENLLDVILSHGRLQKTGQAHYEEEPAKDIGVELNISTLKLRMYKRYYQQRAMHWFLKSFTLPYFHVSYEALCADDTRFLSIVRFLGEQTDNVGLMSSLVKINRSNYKDAILNYEEVRKCLSGTRFSWMLEE